METKTTFTKGNHFVEVEPCAVVIKGVLKNFHIVGTEKYFMRHKTAIQAAHELLLKSSLPQDEFRAKKQLKSQVKNAHKVIAAYDALKEMEAYVAKWNGVIYTETKKKLCADLKLQLKEICDRYKFKNAQHAIKIHKEHNIKTRTR